MIETPELSTEEHNRIVTGTINLASARIEAAGESSIFQLLKYLPGIYPGQAPEEFYVPSYFASHEGITGDAMREKIAFEARQFCPNFDELVKERLADEQYLKGITDYVQRGYRVVVQTNHRNLPDVVLDKAIDAMTLSLPKYLGNQYFELAAVALAKPISLYGYGTEEDLKTGSKIARSAVAVTSLTGGVELVWPGTRSIKGSGEVTDEDRLLANSPIHRRREELWEDGGLITNSAASASEDWRIEIGGVIIVIQQTISHGMIKDLTAPRTVVAPRALAFDNLWNARVWTGGLLEINSDDPIEAAIAAHRVQRMIAQAAEVLSGETTRYINDRGALLRIGKVREKVSELGGKALMLIAQIRDRHDVDDLDD